ncbi:MAG: hypothetical protein ACRC62_24855 [Microcoleus sp.]
MKNIQTFNWIVRNNFRQADFWLVNKGSLENLGKPVKDFEPFLTGIKCPVSIDPEYGYYLCWHLHSIGIWRQYGRSSIELGHLRICDIKKIFQSIAGSHRQQKRFIDVKST